MVRILALIAGAVMVGMTAAGILVVTTTPRQAPPRHQDQIWLLPAVTTPYHPIPIRRVPGGR